MIILPIMRCALNSQSSCFTGHFGSDDMSAVAGTARGRERGRRHEPRRDGFTGPAPLRQLLLYVVRDDPAGLARVGLWV